MRTIGTTKNTTTDLDKNLKAALESTEGKLLDDVYVRPVTAEIEDTSEKSVLIVSSQTGGGHRSAAKAIEESLRKTSKRSLRVTVAHRFLEESGFASRSFAWVYNYLLRHHQDKMQYYFRWIEQFRPDQQPFLVRSSLQYGLHLIEKFKPSAVVSVHPMLQALFALALKRLGWADSVPLITVMTDPCGEVWSGWASPDVAKYFVANQASKDHLIEKGVESSRIEISGMPVHRKFMPIGSQEERNQLRASLGLEPHLFTVFVNAGWIGGGNAPKIYEMLLEQAHPNLQIVFLAGRNQSLFDYATHLAFSSDVSVKVLSYTANIENYMQASDVMISKLGGLTTFEALACKLPIIADCLTPPMPQEADTARLVSESGAAVLLENMTELLPTIQLLRDTPLKLIAMQEAASRLVLSGASDRIAQSIIRYAKAV